jgi:hypothetical protein
MIRNLKVLGLGIMAVLAMSAVAASAASADIFTSESSPVRITSKESGSGLVWTFTAGTVKCKEASYTASSVVMPTSTVTMTPSYPAKTAGGEQNCTGFGFPAEINTNGCVYKSTIGGTTTGNMEILCPEGKEITVTAVSAGITKCVVHFGSQTFIGITTYSNTGFGTTREIEDSTFGVKVVKYKHTAGAGVGSCTSGSSSEGSYSSTTIWTGENLAGTAHIGLFLS